MYLARQDREGNWVKWTGRNEVINGRKISASSLLQAYRKGIWTREELQALGIEVVTIERPPEGKQDIIGTRSIVDDGAGNLIDRAQYEDIPPPPVLTPQDKLDRMLADYDLTDAEFRAVINTPVVVRGG